MKEAVQIGITPQTRTESPAWKTKVFINFSPYNKDAHQKGEPLSFLQEQTIFSPTEMEIKKHEMDKNMIKDAFHNLLVKFSFDYRIYKPPEELDVLSQRLTEYSDIWGNNYPGNPASVKFAQARLRSDILEHRLIPEENGDINIQGLHNETLVIKKGSYVKDTGEFVSLCEMCMYSRKNCPNQEIRAVEVPLERGDDPSLEIRGQIGVPFVTPDMPERGLGLKWVDGVEVGIYNDEDDIPPAIVCNHFKPKD